MTVTTPTDIINNNFKKAKVEIEALKNKNARNIGELVYSSIPLSDAGLHLLDGSLIQGTGMYSGFVTYIASLYNATGNPYAACFVTESQWQASISQYGVCGKFVYDSVNNTVRLPKITGIVEGTTDVNTLGDLVEAGLPNITGDMNGILTTFKNTYNFSGAISSTGRYNNDTGSEGSNRAYTGNLNINASRSSSIYGNSTTVQPQTIKVLYYIVVATSTKTDIQVDIDEIATDLNGKADTDLTNVTDTGYIKMAGAGMPSDKYIDLTLGANNSTYTAPANGWVKLDGLTTSSTNLAYGLENMTSGVSSILRVNSNGTAFKTFIPVTKGDVFKLMYEANITDFVFRFVYAVGSESEV